MSWVVGTLVFLIALPVSVWFLASILSVVDEPGKTRPLVRLVLGVCALLVLLILTNRDYLYLMAAAFVIVTLLHVASFYMLRRSALHVPIYEEAPPPIPLIEDREDVEDETEARIELS